MSEKFDKKRRQLIKTGLFSSLTLFLTSTNADELLDIIAESKSTSKSLNRPNKIISVRIWPSDVYTRLTIEADKPIKAKYFNLKDPNRFVIDILDSELNAVLKNLGSNQFENDPIISGIKVGQFDTTTARIVINAKQIIRAQTSTVDPIDMESVKYKYRYIFDMYPQDSNMPSENNEKLDDQLLAFLQLNADNLEQDPKSKKSKNIRRKDVPVIKEPTMISSNKGKVLVVIDPGHGGEDPGAIGPNGVKEKDVVLDIGKRLRDLIDGSGTMQSQMTRTQDIFIPLATRVAIARKAKADIFISIHADGFTSPSARGSSVFMLSEGGASSAFAKYMAVSQNNADLIGGMSFKTRDSVVSKILLDMTQGMTMRNSSKLASIVLDKMKSINKLHGRNVEKGSFAVLKAPDIPSILVESAFVTNPTEEALLRTDEFRQKVAQQVFSGLEQYVKQNIKLS
ncbi:MAG: N-acetylmuramoyl-L-alanine amidase [Burkholderiales bacterium]|nr:N-acetylmuramoyl-L-alanine amidase [Burkholderiales bacterium]